MSLTGSHASRKDESPGGRIGKSRLRRTKPDGRMIRRASRKSAVPPYFGTPRWGPRSSPVTEGSGLKYSPFPGKAFTQAAREWFSPGARRGPFSLETDGDRAAGLRGSPLS
jgi:hypothetical protein